MENRKRTLCGLPAPPFSRQCCGELDQSTLPFCFKAETQYPNNHDSNGSSSGDLVAAAAAAEAADTRRQSSQRLPPSKQVLSVAKAWLESRRSSKLFLKVMSKSQVSGGYWEQLPRGLEELYGRQRRKLVLHCDDTHCSPEDFRHNLPGLTPRWEVMYLPRSSSSSNTNDTTSPSQGGRTGGGVGLSGGWRGFAIDQGLVPDDVVVFEVLDHDPITSPGGGRFYAAAAAAAAAVRPASREHMRAHVFRVADYAEDQDLQQQLQGPDMPVTPALLPAAGASRRRRIVKVEQPDFETAATATAAALESGERAAESAAAAAVMAAAAALGSEACEAAAEGPAGMAAGRAAAAATRVKPEVKQEQSLQAAARDSPADPLLLQEEAALPQAAACANVPSTSGAAATAAAAACTSSDSVVLISDSSDRGDKVPPLLATPAAAAPATSTSSSVVIIVSHSSEEAEQTRPRPAAAAAPTPPSSQTPSAAQPAVEAPAALAAAGGQSRSLAAAACAAGVNSLPPGFQLAAFSTLPDAMWQLQQLLDVLCLQELLLLPLEAAAERLDGLPAGDERLQGFMMRYGFVAGHVKLGAVGNVKRALGSMLDRALAA